MIDLLIRSLIIPCIVEQKPIEIAFFNWLSNITDENTFNNIPQNAIYKLIDFFCKNNFNQQDKETLYEKVFLQKFPANNNIIERNNYFDYYLNIYKSIKYKSLMLFPNADNNFHAFLKNYKTDIDALTDNYLLFFIAKKDETDFECGHSILKELKSFYSDDYIILPSLLIWDKDLKNAISIYIGNINNHQLFNILQIIVRLIKTNQLSFNNIENHIRKELFFLNKSSFNRIVENGNIIINGNNFEFIADNQSFVNSSFNEIK